MTQAKHIRWLLAGAAMISLPGLAMAQNSSAAGAAGSVASPAAAAKMSTANPQPPAGPYLSPMPLAGQDQFLAAEKGAVNAVPTGTPGSVTTSGVAASLSETPSAFGSSTAPYTTARVAVTTLGSSTTAANTPVTSYPNRATGKLYFNISGSTYVCSASLVKKGVLITAAHCVFNFGKTTTGWYSGWTWCPANTSSTGGVYGCYSGVQARVLTPYYNGTDVCTQTGVVCNNDLATITVAPKSGVYAGTRVGWYAYGWNGYSYKASSFLGNVTTVQITQLGYPVAFDSGYQMERTDAVGWYYASGNLKNTQIGSAQTGGSSGGPWLVNYGTRPVVSSSASLGSASNSNVVVGVTSYGSTTIGYNRQGASYFGQNTAFPATAYGTYGAGNIGKLMYDTCTANPAYC